jgi:8-oxo-dGTP pyrophosphatase MutT (NUDIX family)
VDFDRTLATLTAAFSRPLPGAAAQELMAPRPRRDWPAHLNPARIRLAAGLLLVYPADAHAHVVLTVRADTLGRHSGQVALPGGAVEPGETFEQAALREAQEEVALAPEQARPLGLLTPIDIVVSGFRLHPVVAWAERRPPLYPADGEVARILDLSVDGLMEPSSVSWRTLERDGRAYEVPIFRAADAELWGATAMVVAEFLVMLGWDGPGNRKLI